MMTTGTNENINVDDVDVKNYIKFLLQEDNNQEKQEVLTYLDREIKLKNKVIEIN